MKSELTAEQSLQLLRTRLLSYADLSDYTKISQSTLRRMVMNDELPYYKIGRSVRFRLAEIEEYFVKGGLQ